MILNRDHVRTIKYSGAKHQHLQSSPHQITQIGQKGYNSCHNIRTGRDENNFDQKQNW
jgi:hypothetical protein